MGCALGQAWRAAGTRVVTTGEGRSDATRQRIEQSRLESVKSLSALAAVSTIVVSVCGPGQALEVGHAVAGQVRRSGLRPLFVDLNPIAPSTARGLAALVGSAGLEFVDGSISGPPPAPGGDTALYLSGPQAAKLAGIPAEGVTYVVVGRAIGSASAVKMCTSSVYKGLVALVMQAAATSRAYEVEEFVQTDFRRRLPALVDNLPVQLAHADREARRFADEMHEISQAQEDAGTGADLFRAFETVFRTRSGQSHSA
jgi:3-hydroxyisobutyrate dehydrogenase-like beta-hydroxyacid dehydrogenase